MSDDKSLFDRIGGDAAIQATVDRFYEKILQDKQLVDFFENTNMDALKKNQVAFVTMAFGGPNNYKGSDLRQVHQRLVTEKGLSDAHFDAVANHLAATMRELGVADALIEESLAIVGTTRNEVLCR